ncbi:hypothetical protein F5141DRAFT_1085876 [Pisolithus sp. B1]|nr:hypothetical protein F5141DRAFT_1085876 [Pisolithus sp. B1]
MKQVISLLLRCVMQRYVWTSIILLHLPLCVSAANNPVSNWLKTVCRSRLVHGKRLTLLTLGLLRPANGTPTSGLCVGWRNCGYRVVAVLYTHALHSEEGAGGSLRRPRACPWQYSSA